MATKLASNVQTGSFPALTSAAGVLALLEEPENALKIYALNQLNELMDHHWAEIASSILQIEALFDDEKFPERELAALVASKVFYHLEAHDDALRYALGAGDFFDVNQKTEYVETLIAKCIDDYIETRLKQDKYPDEGIKIDERLEAIVERMFDRCFNSGEYKQALGIALESRRLDIVKESIKRGNTAELLEYCYNICLKIVNSRVFRHRVLREVIIELHKTQYEPDYINMSQCLFFLNDYEEIARILQVLISDNDVNKTLVAYQVAFDLHDNHNYPLLVRVMNSGHLKGPEIVADDEKVYVERLGKLKSILSGEKCVENNLQFLYGQNKTDLNILKNIKDKLDARNSVTHNATVVSHAIMHCGTTIDLFLRENLDWLSKAKNWAKFVATASIGVIQKGHIKESLKILGPYLPKNGQSSSPYEEGGALYAYGLIHSSYGGESATEYLRDALRNSGNNEIVQHGACLGLGLTAMATSNEQIFEELKNIIFTDSAVAGEAAGIAIGLVMLGSGNGQILEELITYAHDTKHEKIIRGLSMACALTMYGREEEADVLIEQLMRDKDPILRYGGIFAIALAYAGTSNNDAIRKLLHVAVSDVSHDVRRAAVTSLGFVLCNEPHQVPRIVGLLSESFNPHVRYGACFAVGIACAGTGMKEALDLLLPLSKDPIDWVRQGAYIGLAMVLMQHNENQEPKVKEVRKIFNDLMDVKGETMAKFGAIIASGIMDAGGRNVTISLLSPAGHKRMAVIVGTMLFSQFWYWYPLVHFISLSFTPTSVIGLNKNLQMPQNWKLICKAPNSKFAYPEPVRVQKEQEKQKKVPKAQLSVSAKAKTKQKKKENEDDVDMKQSETSSSEAVAKDEKDVEMESSETASKAEKKEDKKEAEEEKKEAEEKKEEKKEEAKEFSLENGSRVTPSMRSLIEVAPDQRYSPMKSHVYGFVLLRDSTPDAKESIVEAKAPKIGAPGVDENEPAPPESFEFLG